MTARHSEDADARKISRKIKEEERKQRELFRKLGVYIFVNYSDKVDNQVSELCSNIRESESRILEYKGLREESVDGITCPSCGMAVQKGTRFCTNCGMKLEQIADQTTISSPKQRVCPSCGMKMSDDVLFCTNCGTRLGKMEAEEAVKIKPKSQNICSCCGRETRPGEIFCIKCGNPL